MVDCDCEDLVVSQDELVLGRLGLHDLQGTKADVLPLLGLAVVPGKEVKFRTYYLEAKIYSLSQAAYQYFRI